MDLLHKHLLLFTHHSDNVGTLVFYLGLQEHPERTKVLNVIQAKLAFRQNKLLQLVCRKDQMQECDECFSVFE